MAEVDGRTVGSSVRHDTRMSWGAYATTESTGLAVQPGGPGSPWLMDPGTAGAHIMIHPPRSAAR